MNYYVYYTFKNDEPNKAYIGMTSKNSDSGYMGSGNHIKSALKKYGKGSFTRTDLGIFEDKDECHFWEGFYIKMYKTETKYGGYNLSPKGGLGTPDCHSEETKRKMSESHKGKNTGEKHHMYGNGHLIAGEKNPMYGNGHLIAGEKNPMYGKPQSEEARKKNSESHKGKNTGDTHHMYGKGDLIKGDKNPMYGVHRYGIEAPNYGTIYSDEVKLKISESLKGRTLSTEHKRKIMEGMAKRKEKKLCN
jgi:hypothetical protein